MGHPVEVQHQARHAPPRRPPARRALAVAHEGAHEELEEPFEEPQVVRVVVEAPPRVDDGDGDVQDEVREQQRRLALVAQAQEHRVAHAHEARGRVAGAALADGDEHAEHALAPRGVDGRARVAPGRRVLRLAAHRDQRGALQDEGDHVGEALVHRVGEVECLCRASRRCCPSRPCSRPT